MPLQEGKYSGLKSFGKELAATFLGLLLALGLEQWRVRNHERHMTVQAMKAVTAELQVNRDNIRQQLARCEESLKSITALEGRLEAMALARSRGLAPDVSPFGLPLGLALTFTPDAWEALKGQGLLRCLPQERVLRLSAYYRKAQALPEMARDNFSGGNGITTMVLRLGQSPAVWARLSETEFREFGTAVQLMRAYFLWAKHELERLQQANQQALLP
jgi:hypothetical protein